MESGGEPLDGVQARDVAALGQLLRGGSPGRHRFVPAIVATALVVVLGGILVAPRLLDDTVPVTGPYDTPRVTSINVGFTGPLAATDDGVWIDSMRNTRGKRSGLSRIDPDTNEVTDGPPAVPAGGVFDIDIGDSGVWVTSTVLSETFATRAGIVQRLDPDSMRVVAEVRIREHLPFNLTVTDEAVWAAGIGDDIWRIDPRTARIIKRINMPRLPTKFFTNHFVIKGEGSVWDVIARDTGGEITPIDPQANKLVGLGREIETGPCPLDAAVGYESVWVLDGCWNVVLRFDRGTRHFLAAVPIDGDPSAVALAGGFVWIANGGAGTVVRIDAGTNRVAGPPIDVDGVPQHITSGAGAVWVAPQGDDVVSRIDFEPIDWRL